MHPTRAILEAIDQLYAATLATEDWDPALEAIRRLLHANHLIVISQGTDEAMPPQATPGQASSSKASSSKASLGKAAQPVRQGGDLIAYAGLDEAGFAPLVSIDGASLLRPIYDALPLGTVVSSSELIDERDYERCAAYNELIKPINGFHFITIRKEDPERSLHVVACRERAASPFGPQELETFGSFLPHLETALKLRHRMRDAKRRNEELTAILDRFDTGVILTDPQARPVFLNRRAERLLDESDGLALVANGLAAADGPATRQLREAVASLCAADATGERRLRLPRPSRRPPLALHLLPAWQLGSEQPDPRQARIAILVKEPDTTAFDQAAIAEIFHLSRRESELAALLASGLDLASIAAALGLGIGSVRSYLSRIYDKTQVHHQAALVALIRNAML